MINKFCKFWNFCKFLQIFNSSKKWTKLFQIIPIFTRKLNRTPEKVGEKIKFPHCVFRPYWWCMLGQEETKGIHRPFDSYFLVLVLQKKHHISLWRHFITFYALQLQNGQGIPFRGQAVWLTAKNRRYFEKDKVNWVNSWVQSFSGDLAASACDFFADQGPLEVPRGPFKKMEYC